MHIQPFFRIHAFLHIEYTKRHLDHAIAQLLNFGACTTEHHRAPPITRLDYKKNDQPVQT